jgi:exonuclease III
MKQGRWAAKVTVNELAKAGIYSALPVLMSLLSWNCRGLGSPRTVKDLCQLVKEKKPNMVFLMETKLRSASFDSIKAKLGFSCVFVVDSKGRSGGLALSGKNITT